MTAELDGPFATGSRGATRLPVQEPLHWLIREVTPPNAATTEMSLEGAALSFEWGFVEFADGRTLSGHPKPASEGHLKTGQR